MDQPRFCLGWGEGSTGQSYHCEATEGDFKGEDFYVKLIPREISEMNGFEDHFMQECQMLEQLEGKGQDRKRAEIRQEREVWRNMLKLGVYPYKSVVEICSGF